MNEKGRLPHLGVERTVCLVAAALLELQLEGCVAVDKKYVTVTGPLPEGQAHLRPLYAFVNRPKPIRKEKLLEEYTYTVTDAQRDELLESIGRSLADLGLVQPVKVGLLGKKKGYAPHPGGYQWCGGYDPRGAAGGGGRSPRTWCLWLF